MSLGADERAQIHQREEPVAARQLAGEAPGRVFGIALAEPASRDAFDDPADVGVERDGVGLVGLGRNCTRGVAPDTRQLREAFGPTVLRDTSRDLPGAPGATR